jgi:hypothetical protein
MFGIGLYVAESRTLVVSRQTHRINSPVPSLLLRAHLTILIDCVKLILLFPLRLHDTSDDFQINVLLSLCT